MLGFLDEIDLVVPQLAVELLSDFNVLNTATSELQQLLTLTNNPGNLQQVDAEFRRLLLDWPITAAVLLKDQPFNSNRGPGRMLPTMDRYKKSIRMILNSVRSEQNITEDDVAIAHLQEAAAAMSTENDQSGTSNLKARS